MSGTSFVPVSVPFGYESKINRYIQLSDHQHQAATVWRRRTTRPVETESKINLPLHNVSNKTVHRT
jgi:hypothetical protein